MPASAALKEETCLFLEKQGYAVEHDVFYPRGTDTDAKRKMHAFSRKERIAEHIQFIQQHKRDVTKRMIDAADIEVDRISPLVIPVTPGSEESILFRWWNLVWWSLPYEKAYGRQMRFVVWDNYHQAPMGLIGLQSPILNWSVRDKHLGINSESRDFWVNQSMSAQRLGALPPYNAFLGGKLVASIMTSDEVRDAFRQKYENIPTVMRQRTLPADLLFVTTTGAYGKSSVYNRLSFRGEKICRHIGSSLGYGSFHIPNTLYEGFIAYLQEEGYAPKRGYGNGPSLKVKNIDLAMQLLGFKKGAQHGMGRAVYLFPFVKNLSAVIQQGEEPRWNERTVEDLSEFWRERWASKRTDAGRARGAFRKKYYISRLSKELEDCMKMVEGK